MTGWLLLVLGCLAALAGGALGARCLRLVAPLERLLAVLVLAASEIVLVSLAAGVVVHRFDRAGLLTGTAVVDLVLAGAVVRLRPPRPAPLAAVLLATVRSLSAWQRVVVAAAVVAVAWRVLLVAVLPPFAYDALSYHLPAVASWVQSGRIAPNPYAFCCGRYPSNAEVLFAWPTVLLGRDTVTDGAQVVALLLGALAVAALARSAGVTRAGALTASALFALTPIVLTQANTDYNDLTAAAFFLASLACSARARAALVLPAGLAAGLVLGTKPNGAAFAVLALVPLLALAARGGRRAAATAAAVAVGGALLTGGYWYARNWVEAGNPVAPFAVHVLGVHVFDGPASPHDYLTPAPAGGNPLSEVAHSWGHDLVFWSRGDYSYEERSGGLGPLWSWLGWPLLTLASLGAIRRRPDLVLRVLLPAAAAFAFLPYRWWSRFTIYLPALAAVAVVVVLERLRRRRAAAALAAAVVVLSLVGAALASRRLDPAGFGQRLSAGATVSLALHPSRPRSVGDLFFHEFAWLDRVPAHATIGVDETAPKIRFFYPLFGGSLSRRLVLFDPGEEPSIDPRLAGSRDAYLFVGAGDAFDTWAKRHGDRYRLVSSARGTKAYRRLR